MNFMLTGTEKDDDAVDMDEKSKAEVTETDDADIDEEADEEPDSEIDEDDE